MIFFVLFLDISGNRHPPASPSVRGFWDSGILTTPFLFSSGSHGSPLLLLVPQGSRFPFLSQLHRELFPDSSAAHVPPSRFLPAHPRRLTASSVAALVSGTHGHLDFPPPGLCSVFSLILGLFPPHVLLALPLSPPSFSQDSHSTTTRSAPSERH